MADKSASQNTKAQAKDSAKNLAGGFEKIEK